MKPLDPRLLRYAGATKTYLAVSVGLGVATAALVVTQAELLSKIIADVVATGLSISATSTLMVGLAAVIVGRIVVAWMQDSAAQRSASLVKGQLRQQLLAHTVELGPRSAGEVSRAEVATLTTRGVDALDGYFGQYLPQLILAIVVPIAIIVRLATVDLAAAIIVVLTLPLIPVFMALVGLATEASNAKRWAELTHLSHHFLDVVSGMTTLKVFGRAKAQAESVRASSDRYRTTTMATLRVAFLSSLVLELLATLSVALVAVSVGLRLVDGGLDLRTGLLVIVLAPEAYLPLRMVGVRYHAATEGIAAAQQVFAILETPVTTGGDDRDVPDLRDRGQVQVRGLSVTHAGRIGFAPCNAELTAQVGELVVVTGASGAGKSTLMSVLLGAIEPDVGEVIVVGGGRSAPLATLDRSSWRRQLAWVDQRPYLFAGTVAANVRLSAPEASDTDVRDALAAAGLASISPDRVLAEAGHGLSSGEQRRVAMARAIVRNAPLNLLDEPTAGLDAGVERDLLDVIRQLAARSIVIMVSHRPAAIAAADRIVSITAHDHSVVGDVDVRSQEVMT
ncbi:MAG: thiol reductant ABC exporter subunit CydD [Acidimicrobiia bacterium]